MDRLLPRVRAWTLFLIVGLALAGMTAIPLATEVQIGERLLGEDFRAGGLMPEAASAWLRTVRDGIALTSREAPFVFYGTDWLAFGHVAIAIAFVGAYRDPVRNRWLYRFGMIVSVLVPFWALAFGHLRGIPVWWSLIDSAFGVGAFLPAWLCDRWVGRIEAGS